METNNVENQIPEAQETLQEEKQEIIAMENNRNYMLGCICGFVLLLLIAIIFGALVLLIAL